MSKQRTWSAQMTCRRIACRSPNPHRDREADHRAHPMPCIGRRVSDAVVHKR